MNIELVQYDWLKCFLFRMDDFDWLKLNLSGLKINVFIDKIKWIIKIFIFIFQEDETF